MTRGELERRIAEALDSKLDIVEGYALDIAPRILAALDSIPASELAEALGLWADVCHGNGAGCMDARTHRPWANIVRRTDPSAATESAP